MRKVGRRECRHPSQSYVQHSDGLLVNQKSKSRSPNYGIPGIPDGIRLVTDSPPPKFPTDHSSSTGSLFEGSRKISVDENTGAGRAVFTTRRMRVAFSTPKTRDLPTLFRRSWTTSVSSDDTVPLFEIHLVRYP